MTLSSSSSSSNSDEEDEDQDLLPALPKDLQHIPLNFEKLPAEESLKRSEEYYELMNKRRTVRHFSSDTFPIEIIHNIIKTAGCLLSVNMSILLVNLSFSSPAPLLQYFIF